MEVISHIAHWFYQSVVIVAVVMILISITGSPLNRDDDLIKTSPITDMGHDLCLMPPRAFWDTK